MHNAPFFSDLFTVL